MPEVCHAFESVPIGGLVAPTLPTQTANIAPSHPRTLPPSPDPAPATPLRCNNPIPSQHSRAGGTTATPPFPRDAAALETSPPTVVATAMSRRLNPAAERAAANQNVIKSLLKLPGNRVCADCKRNKLPRWASWNLGIFICIRWAVVAARARMECLRAGR